MKIITIDFETYFDKDYSLKKMTTEEYIRDPRFEVLCVCVREPTGQIFKLVGSGIETYLKGRVGLDWSDTAILAHHAHFEGLILSHHFGIKPCMWFDTLSMARMVVGNHIRVGLGSLAEHYGLKEKSVPYNEFMGKRFADMNDYLVHDLCHGCAHDVELTWDIFQRLANDLPEEEYHVIDATVRMFTEPTLIGNVELLEDIANAEREKKNDLMASVGITEKDLQSTAKFCAILQNEGVEIEYKDGKKGPIACVAKTDEFMKGLLTHDNPRVSDLAHARLGIKSGLNQTRAEMFAGMARRGALPVYLNYCGAHTTRWSGGDGANLQNLPRGGELRKALQAPPGYLLAVVDLSQIEARILNYAAGQGNIVEAFAQKRDIYSEGASLFYGRPINKKDHPLERHLGKTIELGCGYGMGAARFQETCRMGNPRIDLSLEEAAKAVGVYRSSHPAVCRYWKEGDTVLSILASQEKQGTEAYTTHTWGLVRVAKGKIYLPNDAWIDYELKWDAERKSWLRKTKTGDRAIWGGGLVENVVQALARVVVSQAILRIRAAGYRVVMTTHDEVVCLIPDDADREAHYNRILEIMKETPDWLPGIPLDAEGGYSDHYNK